MSRAQITRREAPELPADINDWVRKIKHERNLNDLVEDIHRGLVNENAQYRAYLRATYDQHAITGSLAFDNCKACEMIQAAAKELNSEVADEKLGVINQALGVVLRRYEASRKQRRNMVGGQQVPPNHTDGE